MKTQFKRLLRAICMVLMFPLYLLLLLCSLLGQEDSCFQSLSQLLSLIPGKIGVFFRAAFYHLACPATSDDIVVGFLTLLSHRDTTIEGGVYIGPQCNIGKCTISRDTLLGSGVHVLSGKRQHGFGDPNLPIRFQPGQFEKIHIGQDCWLGNGAVIMASVADQCIVGAGSVVTMPTERGNIYTGNPAVARQHRFKEHAS